MAKKNNSRDNAADNTAKKFEPTLSVSEQADQCLEHAALEMKVKLARLKESRELRMKAKVMSCHTIDALIEASADMTDEEKSYWKRVKLDLSVR